MYMLKGPLRLTIPNQRKYEISSHLLAKILKQSEITLTEWTKIFSK